MSSETWYMGRKFSDPKVEPVEVERSTESSVWINGRRNAIEADHYVYCRTFDEARKKVVDHYTEMYEKASRRTAYQKNLLTEAQRISNNEKQRK